jgi:hypothetical protein
MALARDFQGTVFRNGSAVLLARVVDSHGDNLNQASLASASYTIFALEPNEPESLTPVEGHVGVALDVEDVIFDVLQTGNGWTVDEVGYNFRHELDISDDEAFTETGRVYQIRYELLPVTGQKLVFRYCLKCI